MAEVPVVRELEVALGPQVQTPVPPPYSSGEEASPLELRGSLDCWACAILITAQNLVIGALNALLVAVVFGVILLPATVMLVFGFLCHSKVLKSETYYCMEILNDNSSTALIVVGFVLLVPLMVLALAAYCRVARCLQLGLCFIPYSKAVYKNLPASRYYTLGFCCGQAGQGDAKVWV
uniref:Transmembrane protein 88 n=2 Tax=Latimeria chalumnae TaxID=7897 RepID=H3AFE8_LATCH